MPKQKVLFEEVTNFETKYTKKIESPVYEPKNVKPKIYDLFDIRKTKRLIKQIENSNLSEVEKYFLTVAAYRHTIFNYEKIADFYAHSNLELQNLMEQSALVIIDFDKAIQLGYVVLSESIKKEYLEYYGNESE